MLFLKISSNNSLRKGLKKEEHKKDVLIKSLRLLIFASLGHYYEHSGANVDELGTEECSVISLRYNSNIRQWQEEIHHKIHLWIAQNLINYHFKEPAQMLNFVKR